MADLLSPVSASQWTPGLVGIDAHLRRARWRGQLLREHSRHRTRRNEMTAILFGDSIPRRVGRDGRAPRRGQPARRRSFVRALFAVVGVLLSPLGAASGLDQLHAFLTGTQGAQGAFKQVVVNKDGRTTQTTSGTFAFQRPGKFRWTYEKPFDQLIVGDGEKVWVYDRDLNQVIVRKLDA